MSKPVWRIVSITVSNDTRWFPSPFRASRAADTAVEQPGPVVGVDAERRREQAQHAGLAWLLAGVAFVEAAGDAPGLHGANQPKQKGGHLGVLTHQPRLQVPSTAR